MILIIVIREVVHERALRTWLNQKWFEQPWFVFDCLHNQKWNDVGYICGRKKNFFRFCFLPSHENSHGLQTRRWSQGWKWRWMGAMSMISGYYDVIKHSWIGFWFSQEFVNSLMITSDGTKKKIRWNIGNCIRNLIWFIISFFGFCLSRLRNLRNALCRFT